MCVGVAGHCMIEFMDDCVCMSVDFSIDCFVFFLRDGVEGSGWGKR